MMRFLGACLFLAATTFGAAASGGLSCENKGGSARIEVQSGVTRGLGSPLFNFTGEVEVKDKAVAAALKRTAFTQEHVRQYWLDGKDLRLGIYSESDVNGGLVSTDLVIMTKATGEESDYAGTYVLTLSDMTGSEPEAKNTVFKGKLTCFVE